jgi:hypothetical protein
MFGRYNIPWYVGFDEGRKMQRHTAVRQETHLDCDALCYCDQCTANQTLSGCVWSLPLSSQKQMLLLTFSAPCVQTVSASSQLQNDGELKQKKSIWFSKLLRLRCCGLWSYRTHACWARRHVCRMRQQRKWPVIKQLSSGA